MDGEGEDLFFLSNEHFSVFYRHWRVSDFFRWEEIKTFRKSIPDCKDINDTRGLRVFVWPGSLGPRTFSSYREQFGKELTMTTNWFTHFTETEKANQKPEKEKPGCDYFYYGNGYNGVDYMMAHILGMEKSADDDLLEKALIRNVLEELNDY
ncbi:hypothetical protein FQA39_LY19244 [Lamprigera yunnana]|nr:hypothetical protein FQA39_LY19244 [Lamprigera yunnana]